MAAREKPHCGVSGVPFMKSTTGADDTALSIAERVWSERRRAWKGVRGEIGVRKRGAVERTATGRRDCRRVSL